MHHVTIDTNTIKADACDSSQSERDDCAKAQNILHVQIFGKENAETVFEYWRKLESQRNSSDLMCSANWTQTWFNCYHETVNIYFAVGFIHEQVCGICLLSESKHDRIGPIPIRTLHLGTAGEPQGESVCVEYNNILCDPKHRDSFVIELQKHIEQKNNWDRVQLDGIPCQPKQAWPVINKTKQTVRTRECRYFDLEHCRANGGDILSLLGKSTRSNIKRRIKKLVQLEVQWAETLEEATDIFSELIDLHQTRWQKVGQPGAFASERFTAFQKQLIEKLLPQHKVILCRIKTGSQTVGCLYLLVDGKRLLDYVSGLASFDDIPSSGLISHYLCMNEALERGYDSYDFLVGEKRHKENLGKSSQQLQWIVCERNRAIFRVRNIALSVKQIIKRIVKKS